MPSTFNRRAFLSRSLQTAGLVGAGSLLSANSGAALLPNPDPRAVVEIESGKIRGGIADGVHIFRGVPYGADTGGANRFMPPRPAEPWRGVRDTLDYGNMAPQSGARPPGVMPAGVRVTRELFAPLNSQPHSEDCLYLNI